MAGNRLSCTQNSPATSLDEFRKLLRSQGLHPNRLTIGKNTSNFFDHTACIAEGYQNTDKVSIYVKGYGLLTHGNSVLKADSIFEINEKGLKDRRKKGKIRYVLVSNNGSFQGYIVNDDYSTKIIEDAEGNSNFDSFDKLNVVLYNIVESFLQANQEIPQQSLLSFIAKKNNTGIGAESITNTVPGKVHNIVNPTDDRETILKSIEMLSKTIPIDRSDAKVIPEIAERLARRVKSTLKKQLEEEGFEVDNDLTRKVILETFKKLI